MANVVKDSIIARDSQPDVEYRLPTGAEVVLEAGWRVKRATGASDSSMAQAPSNSYKLYDGTGRQKAPSTETSDPNRVSDTQGYSVTTNVSDILNKPGELISLDFVALKTERPKIMSQPGLVDNENSIKASNALKSLCSSITNSSADTVLTPFLLGVLQLAVTYSTTQAATYNDSSAVTLATSSQDILKYGDVRNTIYSVIQPHGYDNPMRQYLRHFSLTTTQAISSGKIQANEKVAMQHGVLKRWVAYSFDFLRPGYGFMDGNATLAWQLSQKSAFDRKQKSNQQEVHNTMELGYKS